MLKENQISAVKDSQMTSSILSVRTEADGFEPRAFIATVLFGSLLQTFITMKNKKHVICTRGFPREAYWDLCSF